MEFFSKHWGDLASLLGLALTIWLALRAKTAAEQARDTALQVQQRISMLDTVGELAAGIATLHEIMRLQRTQAWPVVWDIVLDRYTILQQHLARSQHGFGINDSHRTSIGSAIRQFRIIMEEVERARTQEKQGELDTAQLNRVILDQVGILERVSSQIRSAGI